MMERASRKTSRLRLDEMIVQLRHDIQRGVYAEGAYLPAESTLAEQYRLSNNTVRKGLEKLVGEGWIVKESRVGNRVVRTGALSAPEAQAEVVTLTVGVLPSLESDMEFSRLLAQFERQHPSIRVKTLLLTGLEGSVAYPYARLIERYAAQDMVDAFILNHNHFRQCRESSSLHLLAELAPHEDTYPLLVRAFSERGVCYVQPLVFSPVVLCYNKEHFARAGLGEPDGSWTWDDCLEHARKLSGPSDALGFYFYVFSENRWPNFLLQSGERFAWDEQGRCRIAGSRMLESIRLYKKLVGSFRGALNYYTESSDEVNQLFAEGKASMILTTYMSMNDFKHTGLSYDISPLPHVHQPQSLLITYGLAVSRTSKQKDAARLLIRYLASQEAQRTMKETTLTLPASKPVAEAPFAADNRLNRPSRYSLFRELLGSFRLHEELNLSTEALTALRQLLKQYLSGMIDEAGLCDAIERLPAPPAAVFGRSQ